MWVSLLPPHSLIVAGPSPDQQRRWNEAIKLFCHIYKLAKVRKALIDAREIPSATTRMGADGKLYPIGLPKDEANERTPGMGENAGEDVASIDETGSKAGARRAAWENAVRERRR